jgi:polar amino acid transport system substrate-binding protein
MIVVRCCLLLLILLTPLAGTAAKLRICFDTRPHLPHLTPEGGGTVGVLIKMAAAETGVEIEGYSVPVTRCREEIRANLAAGFPTTPYVPNEFNFLAFPMVQGGEDASRSVMSARTLVFRRKGNKVGWDGKQFHQLKTPVLIVFGSALLTYRLGQMGIPFDDKGKGVDSNFSKLLAGRADIAVAWESDAMPLLSRPEFAGKIEVLPQPFAVVPYYLAISKQFVADNPGVAEQLWSAIGRIKTTPQYTAASKEWLDQAAKPSKE